MANKANRKRPQTPVSIAREIVAAHLKLDGDWTQVETLNANDVASLIVAISEVVSVNPGA